MLDKDKDRYSKMLDKNGYDKFMDKECINLCNSLNSLPGIATTESCCGHGLSSYRIFFKANNLESLNPILQELDSGNRWPWAVDASWLSGSQCIGFCLEGPVGATKEEATKLGKMIEARISS